MMLDFLASHPLLAAFAVTLSFEGALALVFYSVTPACGRHATIVREWFMRTFTRAGDESCPDCQRRALPVFCATCGDVRVLKPVDRIVLPEAERERLRGIWVMERTSASMLPTPEQIERSRKIADFEFETQVLPFRKPRRLEVN